MKKIRTLLTSELKHIKLSVKSNLPRLKKQFNHFSTFRIKTIKLDLHVLHKKLAIQLFNFGGIKIRSLKLKSNTQFIRMFNNDELRVVFKNQSRFLREEVERTWRENKDEIRQKIINKEKESLR